MTHMNRRVFELLLTVAVVKSESLIARARCLLGSIVMKMQLVALTTLALALGCGQKQANGTYHVTDPTPAAKADLEKARQSAAKAGQELKRDTQELGSKIDSATEAARHSDAGKRIAKGAKEAAQGVKQGAGALVRSAGTKIEEAGSKVEQSAKTSTH